MIKRLVFAACIVFTLLGCDSSLTTSSDFSLPNIGSVDIVIGQQTSKNLTLDRKGGFSAPVMLSLEQADGSSLPSGLAFTFTPSVVSGSSSTLTLNIATSMTIGTYALRIKGTSGNLTKTSALSLKILPIPASKVTFRTLIDSKLQNALWVAYQNGDDAWQSLTGSGGNYSFNVSNSKGKYGVVVVCTAGPASAPLIVLTYQFTTNETTDFRATCGSYYGPTATGALSLSGKVKGLAGSATGNITMGTTATNAYIPSPTVSQNNPDYQISNLVSGKYNLSASRNPTGVNGTTPDKMIILRDINLTANTSLDLDFEGSEAFALEGTYTIDVNGSPVNSISAGYTIGYATNTPLGYTSTKDSLIYSRVPASQSQTTDLYMAVVTSGITYVSPINKFSIRYFSNPQNITLNLPADLVTNFDFSFTTNYVRPKISWRLSDAAQVLVFDYGGTLNTMSWTHYVTPGWLEDATEYIPPEFSSVQGWQDAWKVTRGQSVFRNWGYVKSSLSINAALSVLQNVAFDENFDISALPNKEIQRFVEHAQNFVPLGSP